MLSYIEFGNSKFYFPNNETKQALIDHYKPLIEEWNSIPLNLPKMELMQTTYLPFKPEYLAQTHLVRLSMYLTSDSLTVKTVRFTTAHNLRNRPANDTVTEVDDSTYRLRIVTTLDNVISLIRKIINHVELVWYDLPIANGLGLTDSDLIQYILNL